MALKILSALDSARTQWYHFKAIIVAGMGIFTDAYDLFCIPPIIILLAHVHYPDQKIPTSVSSAMYGTSLLGTVIGQLLFGYLGDRIGRRRVYGLSLLLMVLCSLLCGMSVGTSRTCVMVSLGLFRFALGLGIGGDYPLSATIMSEFANRRTRGAFIAAVFSMQGFGILASSAVTMAVCAVFDRATDGLVPADLAWRVILMFGAVPAGMTYYWRMMMPETARYTALVERNIAQATKDMQTVLSVPLSQIAEEEEEEEQESSRNPPIPNNYSLFSKHFLHRHGRDLFSCAATWFLVDIVYYVNNLFQSIVHNLSPTDQSNTINPFHEAFRVARIQAIVALCSTIPGYYATVYFIDRVGRVKIQMMGFLVMALSLLSVGASYKKLWKMHDKGAGFLVLYGLSFFFSNFGPNTTTFIVPAELFPARLRSTCHGISGAAGKVGAIIGSIGFLWGTRHESGWGLAISLMILGGVCILGMVVTYFFTFETNGRSLEENEKDDDGTNGACFLRCIGDTCHYRAQPQGDGHA